MASLRKFRGKVRQTERFAVEFVGHNKIRIGRFVVPGPYALFCGSRGDWRYMQSGDCVYNLILQAKAHEREFELPEQRVVISVACDYILDIEIQHFKQLRKEASNRSM